MTSCRHRSTRRRRQEAHARRIRKGTTTESRTTITVTPPATVPAAAARTIVRLRGALDVAAAPALRERLIGILHPGMSLLVLDLSRVSSCDPAGLAVLIGTQRRARLLGIVVRLAAPSLLVAELLRLTGLDRSFTIVGKPGLS
jgi:anti-sigma B factor antagonist